MPKKPAKRRKSTAKPKNDDKEMLLRFMTQIVASLNRIANAFERPVTEVRTADPVEVPEFMSSQWHRRSGDIYARVAEPGSPNSRDTSHGDDTAGDVRPAFKR